MTVQWCLSFVPKLRVSKVAVCCFYLHRKMQVMGLLKNNSQTILVWKTFSFQHKMVGLWNPQLGPPFGTPIWDSHLGPRFGTPNWDPDMGPRFGTPIWDPDLGPRFGTPIRDPDWDPDLGPRFGTPI
jgi:hypothetical protein